MTPDAPSRPITPPGAVCPNGCDWRDDHEYPFIAAPSAFGEAMSMPPLVLEDLSLAPVYSDGTRGPTEAEIRTWAESDDLPHCIVCRAEVVRTH